MLHGANGYLYDRSLQDGSNKLAYAYGDSPEYRARLMIETLRLRHSPMSNPPVGGDGDEQVSPIPSAQPVERKDLMTRILFVGQKPETVDFSDPSLPPGFDADKINAGIAIAVQKIEGRGWQSDTCMITPDGAGRVMLKKALEGASYDCVVIGAGLRLPPKSLPLFEMVVNAVHKAAPSAAIAFNTQPDDTAEAAARQLNAG
jgi:hypothetical protein